MLNPLNGEQIAAIATFFTLLLGGLGYGAHRSASRAVAPVSADGPHGPVLMVDGKQAAEIISSLDLLIQETGVLSAGLLAHRKAVEAHRESVDSHRHLIEANSRLAAAIAEHADRLAKEMRDLRDETRDLRDEMLRGSRGRN